MADPGINVEDLKHEIITARDDLATRLNMLEHKVRETIDLRARFEVAKARVKQRALDGVQAVKDGARDGVVVVADGARRGASAVADGARRSAVAFSDGAKRGALAVGGGARRGALALGSGTKRGAIIVRDDVTAHPVRYVAIAAAIGVAVGAFLFWRSRRRPIDE